MTPGHRSELKKIRTFPSLIAYLRDEMGWPIESADFEELTFDYTPEELGIDQANAAKIQEIKRLRPLAANQPWGIFFVKFEPKTLPVVALRRILSRVVLKKRASANSAERAAWEVDDLLFVSNFGTGEERQISFAHFSREGARNDLPTLKVLGWDSSNTPLKLDDVADKLTDNLAWPADESDIEAWRATWRSAFTLRHGEVITTSKALAVRLAELARSIRDRIKTVLEIETDNGPVTELVKAFREALVHDLDADGFADMYAQTIAYGLLSARIENPGSETAGDFAAHMRTSPFLKELMESFLSAGAGWTSGNAQSPLDFDELGVADVVELLDAANMEAVVRDFGDTNPLEDPVIHFYELFLKEYDSKKRMERGVFYTPRPVVAYIVRSAHELLRTEFGLADGLADTATWGEMASRGAGGVQVPAGVNQDDPFVTILDPAAGTGTFIVEAIDLIYDTLNSRWAAEGHSESTLRDLWNDYVPRHLLPRLYGYEVLMAPYAIAHLKIGLKLHETGYRFECDERAQVYLTNALEPAHDLAKTLEFAIPALAHEAKAVNDVKHGQRFTVVVGNPPYSKSSQNRGKWIEERMEEYKRTVRTAETQIQALSDDYSKFLRLAHFALEQSGAGLMGYISNNGFLDGPLFRDMRNSLSGFFDGIRIVNLHGDSRKQFTPPVGMADENVFDIQQGVATTILWRKGPAHPRGTVGYTEVWGTRKERYEALQGNSVASLEFERLQPDAPYFLFVPVEQEVKAEFDAGWGLYDVFGTGDRERDNHRAYGAGFVTQQDQFAIGFTGDEVVSNVREFLDPSATEDELRERFTFCSTNQWDFSRARRELRTKQSEAQVRECLYRPFDYRYTVFDRNICTIVRKRITSQFNDRTNLGLLTTRRVTRLPFNNVFVTDLPAEYKVASHDRNTIVFPLWILGEGGDSDSAELFNGRRENLNPKFRAAVARALALTAEQGQQLPAEELFYYVYAILHSPGYRARYGELLKIDFPKVPLTSSLDMFRSLVQAGRELVSCHLVRSPAQEAIRVRYDQSTGSWRSEAADECDMPLRPSFIGPGNPCVGKVGWSDDTVWIDARKSRTSAGGSKVTGSVGFRGVPEEVWEAHIGGYRVCEKWLKDRGPRKGEPGRLLSREDVTHYHRIVIGLYDSLRLMREIDGVVEVHGGWPGAFQAM